MCFLSCFNCHCCVCLNKKKIKRQEILIQQKIRELEILEQSIKRLEKVEKLQKINFPYI